mgnify:FL=1
MTHPKKLFCFGYGYSCDYLGHALEEAGGWSLAGTTRSADKKDKLNERGIDAHIFDYQHPLVDPRFILDGVTHVVISTPPDDAGDPSFSIHAQDILKIPTVEWVGYLSTTGVYGNRDGDWVDETTELIPTSQRGSRRKKAEGQWMSLCKSEGLPLHIFRLAGIYGPGRSALDSIRAGVARRIEKPGHSFSRIHVEDIVRVLMASIANPDPGGVYNVCDDLPAPSHEVIEYACELLGLPMPPLIGFNEVDMSPMAQSFYKDNKRVCNERIKDELGFVLKYPDFREGLKACLEAEDYALSAFV